MEDEEWYKQAQEKAEKINALIIALLMDVPKVQEEWIAIITDLLHSVTDDKGNLINDKKTLRVLAGINKTLTQAYAKSKFAKDSNEFIRNMNDIYKFNQKLQMSANDIKIDLKNVNKLTKQYITDFEKRMSLQGLQTRVIEPVSKIILKHILMGSGLTKLETELNSFIVGNDPELGIVQRFTLQSARDILYQYDGAINAEVQKQYNMNALVYVGSIMPPIVNKSGKTIRGSRPQCIKWVSKDYILIKDLEKEIKWAYKNGQGMIPDTTIDSFFRYRGGYNCRHFALPKDI